MLSTTGFIAETDGAGQVVWVWRIGSGEKIARPVHDPSRCLDELKRARFHGAAPEAISEWFKRTMRRRAGAAGTPGRD